MRRNKNLKLPGKTRIKKKKRQNADRKLGAFDFLGHLLGKRKWLFFRCEILQITSVKKNNFIAKVLWAEKLRRNTRRAREFSSLRQIKSAKKPIQNKMQLLSQKYLLLTKGQKDVIIFSNNNFRGKTYDGKRVYF